MCTAFARLGVAKAAELAEAEAMVEAANKAWRLASEVRQAKTAAADKEYDATFAALREVWRRRDAVQFGPNYEQEQKDRVAEIRAEMAREAAEKAAEKAAEEATEEAAAEEAQRARERDEADLAAALAKAHEVLGRSEEALRRTEALFEEMLRRSKEEPPPQ